ncbi:MAG: ParB/RepB/Spo0J family partition protein [Bacteroidota bacterium]
MVKKSVLGRGLGALMDDADNPRQIQIGSVNELDINVIIANPYQPRTKFDEESLNELAGSIKQLGIIQPITVRESDDGKFQLITGERRYRAAKMAGLQSIPAYVRKADDQGMIEMALVENIQREDLDAIEVALSYQRLIEECHLTQENLSDRVGKQRSTISNYLRLLKLPAKIQLGIRDKNITMGHARAIITIEDTETQLMIYDQILKYDFSVRKVEEVVRELSNETQTYQKPEKIRLKFAKEYADLKNHLQKYFQSNVDFKRNETGKGKIVIHFNGDEDLERIVGILDKLNH